MSTDLYMWCDVDHSKWGCITPGAGVVWSHRSEREGNIMELYASEYERQLKELEGLAADPLRHAVIVRAKSSANNDLLMIQDPEVWEAMMRVWDGHLWPLWPRPVDDLLDVWAGFYAYYEMRPVGLEATSVILCTTPDVHSHGITPVYVMRAKKGEN